MLRVVERLFEAMAAGDTASLRAVFDPGARLLSLPDPGLGQGIQETSVDQFVAAVGGASGTLNEVIHDTEVRVDRRMATVWAPYTFYVDGNLSHCGVNAFHLARTGTRWRILHVTDTRSRDCGSAR